MERLPSMVDMAIAPSERKDPTPVSLSGPENMPRYPYGLGICLTQDELEKLNVDYSDWAVGDHFHLQAMAKITSISENETEGGKNCRVELQIIALSGEDEETESSDDDDEYGE